jgi:hypothetical protein
MQFGRSGTPTWASGDWDASGTTDLADMARLQANLGNPAIVPGSPAAAAVVTSTRRTDNQVLQEDSNDAVGTRAVSARRLRRSDVSTLVDDVFAAENADQHTLRVARVRRAAAVCSR